MSLRRNTFANLIGRIVPAVLALVAIPIFVAELGPEVYGLVGLGLAIESLLGLLDFGISAAVSREVARNAAAEQQPQASRNLLRTLEALYWPVAFLIMLLVTGGADWLSKHAVTRVTLSLEDVRFAFIMLGFGMAARWPISLYQGVLRGLQAQVLMNGIRIAGSVLRIAGGVAAILLIAPTVRVFFTVQLLGSLLELLLVTVSAWRALSAAGQRPRFEPSVLQTIWRYALGFSVTSMLIQLLYWSGILAVAKLSLEEAGFYSVALSLTGVMLFVPYAVNDATFPRFAGDARSRNFQSLAATFGQARFVSTLWAVIIGMPLIFFGSDILYTWTHSWTVATGAATVTAILALGNLPHQLWGTYFTAVTGTGSIRLPLRLTACVVPVAVLAVLPAAVAKGASGVAAIWVAANLALAVGYVVLSRTGEGGGRPLGRAPRELLLVLGSTVIFAGASVLTGGSPTAIRILAASTASLASLAIGLLWLRPSELRLPWVEAAGSE